MLSSKGSRWHIIQFERAASKKQAESPNLFAIWQIEYHRNRMTGAGQSDLQLARVSDFSGNWESRSHSTISFVG